MNCRIGVDLYKKAKKIIPGGTQLLSKRPEMFLPDMWPSYYSKCKGMEVWDLDGNRFIDMSLSGVGTCILGYADPDVDTAVKKAVDSGTMCTLNCPEEVKLAELLCDIHPWANMVRFARSGGEAMAIAVRIARAATGKDTVVFCGYHGWHDWYLAANLADNSNLDGQLLPGLLPQGVPHCLSGTAIPFRYNRKDELKNILSSSGQRVAAIVMEPVRSQEPEPGFLEHVRQRSKRIGAILIFDEITSGWRSTVGGIHLKYRVNPDIAVFAKGMSNGYPMAAVIGIREVMSSAQDSFISSTYWTERVGPVAALTTIEKFRRLQVHHHLNEIGKTAQEGWKALAQKHHLSINVSGIYPLSHFDFQGEHAIVLKTLFTQLMLEEGFLASTSFYASYAHKKSMVKNYLTAVDKAFGFIARVVREGHPQTYLKGAVSHTGFKRLA